MIDAIELEKKNSKVTHPEKKNTDDSENANMEFYKSYADIVEEVFLTGPPLAKTLAKYMKIVVNVEICFMNLGFCCIYVVFVGNNMGKVIDK